MVENLGRGMYRVSDGRHHRIGYAVGPPEARWVFLDGQTYLVDVAGRGDRPTARTHDLDALSSPMPATVVKVTAEPGQRVAAGDVLVMLEAMKMEWPIRSPREAVVHAVTCRVGELVQPGVPLVELE